MNNDDRVLFLLDELIVVRKQNRAYREDFEKAKKKVIELYKENQELKRKVK